MLSPEVKNNLLVLFNNCTSINVKKDRKFAKNVEPKLLVLLQLLQPPFFPPGLTLCVQAAPFNQ